MEGHLQIPKGQTTWEVVMAPHTGEERGYPPVQEKGLGGPRGKNGQALGPGR